MPSPTPAPLPPGSVLLHIGPHKTGTTALQGAFHGSREALNAHGAHYAGPGRQPMLPALAMTGRPGRRGDPTPTREHWEELVDEVRAARGMRVVVSSEFFADSSDEVAAEVVRDLGGDSVHVVVTLRPLSRIMPSQWQQYVQNGLRLRYVDWLDRTLARSPSGKPTPTFWNRHAHGDLVARWAKAVGPDNITVIVLDESDRGMLIRTFEALLDVPFGTLVPETGVMNRSLTVGEVEIVRLLNEEFRRRNWNDALYGRFVRTGVAKKLLALRTPERDEAVITTPRWALERAAEIGAAAAEQIKASGARVIGDLGSLSAVPPTGSDAPAPPVDPPVPASAAAIAIVGTILAGRKAEWPSDPKKTAYAAPRTPPPPSERTVGSLTTAELLRIVAARWTRRGRIRAKARRHR